MSFAQDELTKGIIAQDLIRCSSALNMGANPNYLEEVTWLSPGLKTCPLGITLGSSDPSTKKAREIIDLLNRAGADINGPVTDRPYITPLSYASRIVGKPWFDIFLEMGADPMLNRGGEKPAVHQMRLLIGATRASQAPFDTLYAMLDLGVDINVASEVGGLTLLHLEGRNLTSDSPELLKEMFVLGSNPFIKDDAGKRPLEGTALERVFMDIYHDANRQKMANKNAQEFQDTQEPGRTRRVMI